MRLARVELTALLLSSKDSFASTIYYVRREINIWQSENAQKWTLTNGLTEPKNVFLVHSLIATVLNYYTSWKEGINVFGHDLVISLQEFKDQQMVTTKQDRKKKGGTDGPFPLIFASSWHDRTLPEINN